MRLQWARGDRENMVEEESYTCPKCGMTSYHPDDVKHEYCANCHKTKRELEMEGYLNLVLEHRKGESGVRAAGHFIPFMKEGQKLDIILCVRKDWNPLEERKVIVPGSQTGKCDTCGHEIWLAPSTQELVKQYPNTPTRCMECVNKQLEEEKRRRGEPMKESNP